MGSSAHPHRRAAAVAVLVIVLLVFLLANFFLRGDQRVRQATAKLEPGMSEAEVQEVLRGTYHLVETPVKADEVRYQFYGIDEFVNVVLEKKGEVARVTRVTHAPDSGPWWERLRRRWDHRFQLR
jgi:hypothetical protein